MRKGLPKSIIAKYGITKKAWQVFRGKRHKASNPTRRIKKIGGGIRRRMARRGYFRRFRRRAKGMTIPIAPIIGILAAPNIGRAIDAALRGDFATARLNLGAVIGMDPNRGFDSGLLISNITPMAIGLLVHKFIGGSPLNLNKTLASARVPLIRI